MDTTPADGPLLLSDFPSFEAWVQALSERADRVNHCQHCWHGRSMPGVLLLVWGTAGRSTGRMRRGER